MFYDVYNYLPQEKIVITITLKMFYYIQYNY